MDGDGSDDLVLGNIGENFYLRAAVSAPVKMWVADFDNNGTTEKMLSQVVQGKDMPVFMKRDVIDQVVTIKKQNLKTWTMLVKRCRTCFQKKP
jgi:hypothetical protein